MKAPNFWWRSPGGLSAVLSPLSIIYAILADRPFGKGQASTVPVLCIGNFVIGGAGKTPLAIALSRRLKESARMPAFLSRGHGGSIIGPHLVDPINDDARMVGDESLLLAQYAPTVISADRRAGLAFIEGRVAADVILMDDGFQSARVKPDHAMLVVDNKYGIGNGCVLPAGPLRARLSTQIKHADSLVVMRNGKQDNDSVIGLIQNFKNQGKLCYSSNLKVKDESISKDKKWIAFSGIGHPEKFFETLRKQDVSVLEEVIFADHHFFSSTDAARLLEKAARSKAGLITTTKDASRLQHQEGKLAELADAVSVLEIEAEFDNEKAIDALLFDLTIRSRSY